MAVLPIVRLGDPVLRTSAEPVDPERLGTRKLQKLIDDMVATMRDADGVGLAAPQVGVGLQLFVYEVADVEVPEAAIPLTVVVNPMVEPEGHEVVYDWEGCLSIPDLRGLVPRQPAVRLRALDRSGQPIDRRVEGFEARVVQHEFDHLNGVLFLDRMRDLRSLAFYEEWERFLREEDALADVRQGRVVSFELRILWAGRHLPAEWETLCADYRRRIAPMASISEGAVKVRATGDGPARRRAEADALAAAAPADAFRVALDRRGASVDSEGLALRMERWRAEWPHPVVFFLGSDLGLEPALVESCRLSLSLGPLTLPHALARLVLLEQLYRALSIGAGIQYHRRPF